MNQTIFYKVVSVRDDGQLISYNVNGNDLSGPYPERDTILFYKSGVPTRPRIVGSRLFAYSKLPEEFLGFGVPRVQTWECNITNPQQLKFYDTYGWSNGVYGFWDDFNKQASLESYGHGFPNTVIGDSITLLRRIG